MGKRGSVPEQQSYYSTGNHVSRVPQGAGIPGIGGQGEMDGNGGDPHLYNSVINYNRIQSDINYNNPTINMNFNENNMQMPGTMYGGGGGGN